MLAVTQLVAFAQKVATVVQFFCTVKLAVQIVGLLDKSL
jgi:hypothetical protein